MSLRINLFFIALLLIFLVFYFSQQNRILSITNVKKKIAQEQTLPKNNEKLQNTDTLKISLFKKESESESPLPEKEIEEQSQKKLKKLPPLVDGFQTIEEAVQKIVEEIKALYPEMTDSEKEIISRSVSGEEGAKVGRLRVYIESADEFQLAEFRRLGNELVGRLQILKPEQEEERSKLNQLYTLQGYNILRDEQIFELAVQFMERSVPNWLQGYYLYKEKNYDKAKQISDKYGLRLGTRKNYEEKTRPTILFLEYCKSGKFKKAQNISDKYGLGMKAEPIRYR